MVWIPRDSDKEIAQVLLPDDHPTLRVGLRVLLDQAPDVEVIGEAESSEEALVQIEAVGPDVVVLDCQLPGMGGRRWRGRSGGEGYPLGC